MPLAKGEELESKDWERVTMGKPKHPEVCVYQQMEWLHGQAMEKRGNEVELGNRGM